MAEAPDLSPGTIFGGYRIDRLLGHGGMGTVYLAEQLEDGRRVALKVLSALLTRDSDRDRFLREGRTAASINHPNTVYVYRSEEIDGVPAIAMEFVDGDTLEQKVMRLGPFSVTDAINDTLQVVDGLEAAYRVGILHRDVKPANCFVGPHGEVKVGDFGLSRPVDQADQIRLTQTGLFIGTPVFSSPEQLMGEQLDARSDIYAVGATLYYLLTGKLPYDVDNAVRLIAVVMNGVPTPLAQHRPDIPAALSAVVMKCLSRQREDRYADYASLRNALKACLPIDAAPLPLGRRTAAGMLDMIGVMLLSVPLLFVLAPLFGLDALRVLNEETVRDAFYGSLLSIPAFLLWFGVIEGRWGTSLGKRLAGARVIRTDGRMPGIARGCVRAMVFASPELIPAAVEFWLEPDKPDTSWDMLASSVLLLLLFVRARRSNGYAAEHDRFTGTRVVRTQHVPVRTQFTSRETAVVPIQSATPNKLGPFEVTGYLANAQRVRVAVDPELRRTVWIVARSPDTPLLSKAEQDSARPGCLRWIGGRQRHDEQWDAFASVAGQPIRERLTQSHAWSDIHQWLRDIVAELIEREKSGVGWSHLDVDHIWIADNDRALLLPFAVDASHVLSEQVSRNALLKSFVRLVQLANDTGGTRDTWPFSSRSVLSQIEAAPTDLQRVSHVLKESEDRTESMTFRRRALLWSATVVPMLFMLTGVIVVDQLTEYDDPEQLRLAPLINFLDDIPRQPTEQKERQVRLVASYVVAHFSDVIKSRTAADENRVLSSSDWELADSLIAKVPPASADILMEANQLVDSTWKGLPPGTNTARMQSAIEMVDVLLALTVFFSVLTALTVRRGLPMRLLTLEVVTQGHLAGRWRLFARQLLCWTPFVVLTTNAVSAIGGTIGTIGIVLALVTVIWFAITVALVARSPGRGLAERLSGTAIVPE